MIIKFLPLCSFPFFLVPLWGCSTSDHTLRIDAPQPVYFGNPPKSLSRVDSSRIEFINTVAASTSHVKESPNVGSARNFDIIVGGREERLGNVTFPLGEALEGDAERFIADVSVGAKVEVYVPVWTFFAQFFFTGIFGSDYSSNVPEATEETIEFHGTIYRIRWVKP